MLITTACTVPIGESLFSSGIEQAHWCSVSSAARGREQSTLLLLLLQVVVGERGGRGGGGVTFFARHVRFVEGLAILTKLQKCKCDPAHSIPPPSAHMMVTDCAMVQDVSQRGLLPLRSLLGVVECLVFGVLLARVASSLKRCLQLLLLLLRFLLPTSCILEGTLC